MFRDAAKSGGVINVFLKFSDVLTLKKNASSPPGVHDAPYWMWAESYCPLNQIWPEDSNENCLYVEKTFFELDHEIHPRVEYQLPHCFKMQYVKMQTYNAVTLQLKFEFLGLDRSVFLHI